MSSSEPERNTSSSGPRYQLYRWFFTLKADGASCSNIYEVLKENCKQFYFQLEKSESGYNHYQGCFSLYVKHRLNEVKNLLGYYNMHLEPIKDWHKSIQYCTKEETRVMGPFNHKKKPLKYILDEAELYSWQKDIVNFIQEEPDNRTIYWCWSKNGCKGKSALIRYLLSRYNCAVFKGISNKDIAYQYDNEDIVVFEYTKDCNVNRMHYNMMEAFKDGYFSSGKYKSKLKLFNPPHVLVFANCEPLREKLSEDRWVIRQIE